MWSFCIAKGFVLVCKRSPFTVQKESFWKAKGPLLKNSRFFSPKQTLFQQKTAAILHIE